MVNIISNMLKRISAKNKYVLSSGTYGEIYVCKGYLKNGTCIDIIEKSYIHKSNHCIPSDLIKELSTYTKLFNQPHIAFMYDFKLTRFKNSIFLEKGLYNLKEFISTVKLNKIQKINLMYQFASGLYSIHSNNIIHCDLKPANIIITNNVRSPILKIIDFGLAIPDDDNQNKPINVQTPCYKSPEILMKYTNYDNKIDIWSFGLIILEIAGLEKSLFYTKNYSDEKELDKILNFIIQKDFKKFIPKPFQKSSWFLDLIERIFVFESTKRINIYQILNHPLFNSKNSIVEQKIHLPDIHQLDFPYIEFETDFTINSTNKNIKSLITKIFKSLLEKGYDKSCNNLITKIIYTTFKPNYNHKEYFYAVICLIIGTFSSNLIDLNTLNVSDTQKDNISYLVYRLFKHMNYNMFS
jgi:serine/threonine protein kinase